MKKKIIISLSIMLLISVCITCYFIFFNKRDNEIKEPESNTNIELVETIEEMEEIQDDTQTEIMEDNEVLIDSGGNDNIISNKNDKKGNTTSSSNVGIKNNNSKSKTSQKEEIIKENTNEEVSHQQDEETTSTQTVNDSQEKEKKEETSKSVEVIIEEPEISSIENDPTYIKMKKELFSSISECDNKGMELNLKDMENIASTMCSSESYKGVEVGFRLYIRYNDGTYKEYKK